MRVCPKCKAVIESDTAKFCRHCGSPLTAGEHPVGGEGVVQPAPGKTSGDSSQKGQRTYVRTTEIFIPADDRPKPQKPRPNPQPQPDRAPTQPKPPVQPAPKPPVTQPEADNPTFSVPVPKPVVAPAPASYSTGAGTKASYGLFSAMGHIIRNYANFSGRAPRSEYWNLWLFNLLLVVLWVGVGVFITNSVPEGVIASWMLLFNLYNLFIIVPAMAVTCRRLHDTNRSGWMMLLALVPFVGAFILLIMLAQPGTPYTNTYGTPPGS